MTRSVPTRERIAYGLGDFGNGLIFNGTTTYLMFFYTERLGLTAAAAGLLLFIARFWDAVIDPVMGIIADRTRTRWGRFRPFLLFVPIPLILGAIAAYHVPHLGPSGRLAWAYGTYMLLMALYTAVNIPYGALLTALSKDPEERAELTSWRMTGSFSSGVLINLLFIPLAAWFAARNAGSHADYTFAVAVIGVVAIASYWLCFAGVRERVFPAAASAQSPAAPSPSSSPNNLKSDFAAAISSPAWWTLMALGCSMFALGIFPLYSGLYYLHYVAGDETLAPAYFASATGGMLVGTISNLKLLRYVAPRPLSVAACVVGSLCGMALFLLPSVPHWLLYLLTAGEMLAVGVGAPVMWALVAECVDMIERRTGQRIAGLTTSALSFATKFGFGLGGSFVGLMLTAAGFHPGGTQPAPVLVALTAMVSLVPAIGHIVFAVLLFLFPTTARGDASPHAARIPAPNP
ncbi:glycoside-pentoside-hexuronide (GPH):cation symporter [Novosphingobium sp. 1949]|uniref:Glycoside-pentoside-hexuronide (GPH):cation symporter n=1 Tax=Novosphingobium organovorum TaxID=2930092 RepID=A0ABT0BBS6_9SPHN|nr:glycoside-pentoside-hexuronide (GPH):cation symporter [Novosphingobium organovorum]MCJ2182509.1 glycoside-pentoside-hexuronide (GPH):cation symporter [Novosphingobium organovorum]